MRRILVAALLAVAVSAHATVSWTPTKSSACTALNAPTACCILAAPGQNPSCIMRTTGGPGFAVHADLLSDGGTYTSGGDALTSAAFGALGLAYINWANCTVSNGMDIVVLPDVTGKAPKFKLFASSGTEASGAIANTVWITCDFFGR